jgi:hypothetical protein
MNISLIVDIIGHILMPACFSLLKLMAIMFQTDLITGNKCT